MLSVAEIYTEQILSIQLGSCRDKASNCESSNGLTIRVIYHELDSVSFNKS